MRKHISYRSSELLNPLLQNDKSFFNLKEAMEILSNSNPAAVRRLLSDMTKRGLLLRIKDGLYTIIPYEKDPGNYLPNWHLVAEALVQPQNYYIGFYSALDLYGLITQPALTEQVVTEKQIVPKFRIIKKVKFEFITMGKRFFGYNKIWIDNFNKVYCSDIEKTILDCLYMPGEANGISGIVNSLSRITGKINPEKLLPYLDKFDSQAVYKRLGFILQNMDVLKDLRAEISKKISSSYILLDPSLPKSGKYNSEWKIIDNIVIHSALQSVMT
jgi:predicted transcriptional regulator of viral defense system